jgi:pimeloyl-ACP methyl ester carboxylesterase
MCEEYSFFNSRCRMEEHNIELGGYRYCYYLVGRGKKAVVMLHGLTEDKEHMMQMLDELYDKSVLKSYTFLIPDLPGHGGIPVYEMSTEEDHARYILRLTSHLKINKFALVGFSYGGLVSLSISDLSDNKTPLVLWATPVVELSPFVRLCMRFLGILPNWLYRIGVHTPIGWLICWIVWGDYAGHAWKSAKKFDNKVARTASSHADVRMLRSPAPKLFIFGTKDMLIQERAGQKLKQLEPQNAEIVTIRRGGHAFSDEGINLAFLEISAFLKRNL